MSGPGTGALANWIGDWTVISSIAGPDGEWQRGAPTRAHIAPILGGKMLRVGPIQSLNFPWVLLGRAVLHHKLVAERNHAVRTKLVADIGASFPQSGAVNVAEIPTSERLALERSFAKIRGDKEIDRQELSNLVYDLLSSRWGDEEDQNP